MAGVFSSASYAGSYANLVFHPCRVQPETLAASAATSGGAVVNNTATTAPNIPISARVGGSRRQLGLHARLVSLQLTGTPPAGYAAGGKTRIPALTTTFYNACTKGIIVTYLGTTWKVVGTTPEATK